MASSFWNQNVSPDHEPHRILIERGEWTDSSRKNRKIPYKIYYPADLDGKLPVIIWSHGLGGSRDGAGFLGRYLASHGYVLVHIQHYGTDSSLWEGKPGHPWDIIRATKIDRDRVIDRYLDVPFALDQLPLLAPEIAQRMDIKAIGMSGHSFGANTTQVMAGQLVGQGAEAQSLREPRFKCGILYSMVPSNNRVDPPRRIYGPIALPLFHMTGTADTSPVEGFDYTRRLEVFENSGGPDQQLLILKNGDHMIYNGSRGKLEDNPKRDIHEKIIKIGALAFWNGWLKGDQAARSWLTGGGFSAFLGDEGAYTYRP